MAKNNHAAQLSADKAEKVVGKLKRAQKLHRAWLKKFQAMLACRSKPSPRDLKKNGHLKSPFGRWYKRETNKYLTIHPLFAGIGENHKEMHRAARSLAQTVGSGASISSAQYDLFVEKVDAFKLPLRKLANEAEEFLRFIDPLTGAANRFVMTTRIEQERQRVKRAGQPCCIGMMDLDHFKKVNDTHGHRAGDVVLREVAHYLLRRLRRYDQFFRYGGEEFVIMLPNTRLDLAKRVLDRLRLGLRRHQIRLPGKTVISISASFGVAPLKPNHMPKFAIDHADKAMYRAKEAGRNRVHIWQGKK